MVVGADAKAGEFRGFMSQDLRLPKYEATRTERPEKVDELYSVSWPHGNNTHFEHRVDQVLGSATLFAPLSHEQEDPAEILLERPVTPINEEIKAPPTSFNQLVKFVRRRIAAKRDAPYLSVEDQQNLAGILMGEVNGIWREVKKQVDDPFLSPEENRELNRRMSVYIVTVCERLFKRYLHKAVVLNSRGVFTGPANMSRLKAQLALDANRLLNVLTVRRYIVSDMRGHGQTEESEVTPSGSSLSFNALMQSIRPTSGIKRRWHKTPIEEVEEISDSMPSLDTTKLLRLLEGLPEPVSHRNQSEAPGSFLSGASELGCSSSVMLEQLSRKLVLSKRSESLPLLRGFGETLLEELDVIHEKSKPDVTYNVTELLTGTKHDPALMKITPDETVDDGFTAGGSDLRQLVERSNEIDKKYQAENDQEELPSLLQAMTLSKKHDNLRQRLDQQMEQLEKTQQEDEERERITIQEPSHPQPATVTSKPNNQMPVQTSDIRVSERVCMSSLTLQSYDTVYNDLQDEVSRGMMQQLDKSLYLEDEIREVYREVMKSVPTRHRSLEQDDLVMPSADHVDLSSLMPSATLNRRKGSRLINPALETPIDAPWGNLGPNDWVKTPLSPPKNPRGENQFPPVTPNMEKIADILKAKNNGFQLNENMPPAVAEKMARTYASWFHWWKNTVSTDDYLKYVSTQDTDFLGVSYHFYDDEDYEGTDEPTPTPGANLHRLMGSRGPKRLSKDGQPIAAGIATPSQLISMEKEKKLAEMKAQKSEFTEGFWNVNSVMMGGLGKDPEIEDKEVKTQRDTPDSDSSRRAKQTLKARAQARQSAKSRSRCEGGVRRPSEVGGRRPSTTASRITESPVSQSARSTPVTEKPSTPQERLERVWNALHMPDAHRLDMAIKYSCQQYYTTLEPAMEKWEQVTELILEREALLASLEKFERTASDPNRFFVKGHKGSSAARLDEARERSYFYGRIEDLEDDIKTELDYIKNNFNDVVTFKGRPYVDKMKWDRIEMLYWLGEERKHNAIKYESLLRQIPLKTAHLEPILLETRG